MRSFVLIAAAIAATPTLAGADKLGEHPGVVVQRLHAQQGYDYASKFYPHPAWLYLAAEAPRPMSDHPAVIVARREQQWREWLAAGAPPPAPAKAPTNAD